jgi:hypothetical protein
MAVNVKVNGGVQEQEQATPEAGKVQVNIAPPPVKVSIQKAIVAEFRLDAREALNGDIMIFDHKDIDIMFLKEKNKVIAFAKDLMSEAVYGAENRLMTFLKKRGIIAYDSIQGGNVYGSIEAKVLDSKELNALNVTLKNISEWIESERPYFEAAEDYEDMISDSFADPAEDDTTALGKVPQEEEKGSIRYKSYFSPYYTGAYLYENKKENK